MGCGASKPTASQSKPMTTGSVSAPAPAHMTPVAPVAAKPAAAAVKPARGPDPIGGNPKSAVASVDDGNSPSDTDAAAATSTAVEAEMQATAAKQDDDRADEEVDAKHDVVVEIAATEESGTKADQTAADAGDAEAESQAPVPGDGSVADFYNRGREAVMGGGSEAGDAGDAGDDPNGQGGSSHDEGADVDDDADDEDEDAGFGSDAEGDGLSLVGSSAESAGMSGSAASVGGATGAGNESAGGASSTRAVLAADAERADLGAALADVSASPSNTRQDLTAEQSADPSVPDIDLKLDPVVEVEAADDLAVAAASPGQSVGSPGRTPKHVPEVSNESYIQARDSFRMLESQSAVQRAEDQEASRDLETRRQARMASQWNASTEKGVQEMAAARAAAALANPDMSGTGSNMSWREITARAVIDNSSMAKAGDTRRRFSTMAKSALLHSQSMGGRRKTDSSLKPRTGASPKPPMARHLSASHIKPAAPPQPPALPESPESVEDTTPASDAGLIMMPDIVATVLEELPDTDETDAEQPTEDADEADISADEAALVRVGSMGRR